MKAPGPPITLSRKYWSSGMGGGRPKVGRSFRMGRPLIVMPSATARSRASSTGGPELFTPSPETSMTFRVASKGQDPITPRAWSIAPEIEVQESELRGACASAPAQASASRRPAMRVQGSTRRWNSIPAHSV